jgi:hypothetical protein
MILASHLQCGGQVHVSRIDGAEDVAFCFCRDCSEEWIVYESAKLPLQPTPTLAQVKDEYLASMPF